MDYHLQNNSSDSLSALWESFFATTMLDASQPTTIYEKIQFIFHTNFTYITAEGERNSDFFSNVYHVFIPTCKTLSERKIQIAQIVKKKITELEKGSTSELLIQAFIDIIKVGIEQVIICRTENFKDEVEIIGNPAMNIITRMFEIEVRRITYSKGDLEESFIKVLKALKETILLEFDVNFQNTFTPQCDSLILKAEVEISIKEVWKRNPNSNRVFCCRYGKIGNEEEYLIFKNKEMTIVPEGISQFF